MLDLERARRRLVAPTVTARRLASSAGRQPHRDDVRRACTAAGLSLVAVHGQLPGARLQPDGDESTHTKLVYLARSSATTEKGGDRMIRDP